ncbi:DUF4145 domain-containing protein [Arenicella chitinivorans]|uniref:DUF4145 domain-containing protein n=1 Tax=Arenicella chitinivorans TaxID=1329800 RepID=UPI0016742D99|nr:DUF4145 domain-containing protein [Arenicella chitinivorans]
MNETPSTCPICHYSIAPIDLSTSTFTDVWVDNKTHLDMAFQCTNPKCKRMFIAIYERESKHKSDPHAAYLLQGCAPKVYESPTVSSEIAEISPGFVKIYNQSNVAEQVGLTDICGVGYRKALEFLLKDYCISKDREKTASIKGSTLNQVIQNFISKTELKIAAQRAVWLGNDETHYDRVWLDQDIDDLKALIDLTSAWIRDEILTQQYMNTMTRGNT